MENESSNVVAKGTTPVALNKVTPPSVKSKIPTTQLPRMMRNNSSGAPSPDNSPLNSAGRMAASKTATSSALSGNRRSTVGTAASAQRCQLEIQYTAQKKRYMALKKELMEKNDTAQKLFDNMTQLRQKVVASGAKDPGKLDEIKLNVVGPVKPPPTPTEKSDQNTLSRNNTDIEEKPVNSVTKSDFIVNMENQLREIPNQFQEFCSDVVKKHETMLQCLSKFIVAQDDVGEEQANNEELVSQLDVFRTDQKSMKSRLDLLRNLQSNMIAELVKNTSDLYEQYDASNNRSKQLDSLIADQKDLRAQLDAALEELQRHHETKERRSLTESQLQKSRTRIRELENHVTSYENKMQQLQTSIKSLETQLKQKDQAMEQRTKDLQKALKNSHELVNKTEKQRDSFESRLLEVKEKVDVREAEMMETIEKLQATVEAANQEVVVERMKRYEAEQMITEMEERYRQVEEKCQQLCELAQNTKDFSASDDHTENEVCLFNELRSARAELEAQKEKTAQLQQEKDEIIAVMHRAANQEDENESKEKLAADVIAKSSEIQALMLELAESQKIAKQAQEKNVELEWQLEEIQSRLHAQSIDGGKVAWNAHTIELQQQVSDLRNALAEVAKHNDELETALTQKQLELEQRDRVLREQSKFLKVRDELLCLMRGKDQVADGETPSSDGAYQDIDEVNKQIAAKTEAIQELYATLENKQLQVLHLEKMVKQMEDQQDRAQAQRTRLENRIAQLELTLHQKTQRSRRFGIL